MKETQRCKTIIQGLLDFARDVKPEKRRADVNAYHAKRHCGGRKRVRLKHVHIENQLSDNMIKTCLDENQIQQVFINILLNALQAVDKNGRITVQARWTTDEQQKINVKIADNGCGIAPNDDRKNFRAVLLHQSQWHGSGAGRQLRYRKKSSR